MENDPNVNWQVKRVGENACFYVTDEVLGAYRNGTRIQKVWAEPGDAHALGARGTVLGSMRHPELGIAYFVEWDDMPGVPVGVIAKKIGPVVGS